MNYEEIKIGDRAEIKHKISKKDIEKFVDLTGDDNKLHIDEAYAKKTSFKKPVAHGMLGASFISTIIGTKLPGDGALWFAQNLEFLLPVRVNDEITIVAEVTKKYDRTQTIELSTEIFNQNRQKVLTGSAKVKVIPQETQNLENEVTNKVPAKTALVIGATGGIGRAVVKKLAEQGYEIGLHFHSNFTLAEQLKKDVEKIGSKAFYVKANLLKEDDIKELVSNVDRKFGRLSILINAATLSLPNIKFEDLIWEDIQKQIDINIKSNFYLIKALLPIMKEQKYGKIITLVTQAIEQPNAEWLHYITAKSALSGFSKALAVELAKYGIRFNMVSPGMTDTDLISEIPKKARLLNAAKTPLKRIAATSDVANAILYLSQKESDFLTGETIRINGGQVML